MPNYSPQTQAKINYLDKVIMTHPDWGSSRLGEAVKAEFGTALKKDYLLREAAQFRESQKITQPKLIYRDERHFGKVMRDGLYTKTEIDHFKQTISRYNPESYHNFVYSETLKASSVHHKDWVRGMVRETIKEGKARKVADALQFVEQRLSRLFKLNQYDPFRLLPEEERPDVVISGLVKIRKLNRDYTERRRMLAQEHRKLVTAKLLTKR